MPIRAVISDSQSGYSLQCTHINKGTGEKWDYSEFDITVSSILDRTKLITEASTICLYSDNSRVDRPVNNMEEPFCRFPQIFLWKLTALPVVLATGNQWTAVLDNCCVSYSYSQVVDRCPHRQFYPLLPSSITRQCNSPLPCSCTSSMAAEWHTSSPSWCQALRQVYHAVLTCPVP